MRFPLRGMSGDWKSPVNLPHHVTVHSCTTTIRMVACPSQPALTACTRCIHTDGYPPQYYRNHSPYGTPMHNMPARFRDVRTELIFKHSANAVAPFGPTPLSVRMCMDVGERMKRPAFSGGQEGGVGHKETGPNRDTGPRPNRQRQAAAATALPPSFDKTKTRVPDSERWSRGVSQTGGREMGGTAAFAAEKDGAPCLWGCFHANPRDL